MHIDITRYLTHAKRRLEYSWTDGMAYLGTGYIDERERERERERKRGRGNDRGLRSLAEQARE